MDGHATRHSEIRTQRSGESRDPLGAPSVNCGSAVEHSGAGTQALPVRDQIGGEMEEEIRSIINKCSRENVSNTPDFVLAQYLIACLEAFERATQQREHWYGRDARPGTLGEAPTPSGLI